MKRFTETEKWKDKKFRRLSMYEKFIFLYMVDNCDNAGFFEADLEYMEFMTGIDYDDILGAIKGLSRGLITPSACGEFYHIDNFLKHQKNTKLNPENNAHKQIIRIIEDKKDLFPSVYQKNLAPEQPLDRGTGNGKGNGKGNGNIDIHNDKLTKTIIDHLNNLYGSLSVIQIQEVMPFVDKFPDIEKFGELAKKIHSETEQRYRGKPLWLCQKVFDEINKKEVVIDNPLGF